MQKLKNLTGLVSLVVFLVSGLAQSAQAELLICTGARIRTALSDLKYPDEVHFGHAWVRLFDHGTTTSYGMWPKDGLKINYEYDRPYSDSMHQSREYCRRVDPAVFNRAKNQLTYYRLAYNPLSNNCTQFAINFWNDIFPDQLVNPALLPKLFFNALELMNNQRLPNGKLAKYISK